MSIYSVLCSLSYIHSYIHIYIHLSYARTQCRNGPGFIDPYFEPFNIIPDPYYGLLATDILGSIYNFVYLVLVNLVLQAIISGPYICICVCICVCITLFTLYIYYNKNYYSCLYIYKSICRQVTSSTPSSRCVTTRYIHTHYTIYTTYTYL